MTVDADRVHAITPRRMLVLRSRSQMERDLAAALGVSSGDVCTRLARMLRDGPVERTGGGPGKTFYQVARQGARQTGAKAKKPGRAAKSADEEEGPVVTAAPSPARSAAAVVVPFDDDDHLPEPVSLLVGEGERRSECRNYGTCLTRFIRRYSTRVRAGKDEPAAHCPSGCTSFAVPPHHAEIQEAMRGGSSALAEAIDAEKRARAN